MPFDVSLFLALLCGHLLGDFVFQTNWIAHNKTRTPVLLIHVGVVTVASYLMAGIWSAWWLIIAIAATHLVFDWLKVTLKGSSAFSFWLDQFLHVIVLLTAAALAPEANFATSEWVSLFGAKTFESVMLVTSGLIVCVWMGGFAIGFAIKDYLPSVQSVGTPDPSVATADRGLLKGGQLIGRLERILIFFFVLTGRSEAIAFLVAAKSIFRFGELKDSTHRAEAEYILIGTLMSFTWGLITAWITARMLALL